MWANKLLAVMCIWSVTLLQAWNSRAGVVIINFATVVKVTALAVIAFLGIFVLCISAWTRVKLIVGIGKGEGSYSRDWFEGSSGDLGHYAVAMFSGLWAYAGTNYSPFHNVKIY